MLPILRRFDPPAGGAIALILLAGVSSASGQTLQQAPLPPGRPFDLDLKSSPPPVITVPSRPAQAQPAAPAATASPNPDPTTPASPAAPSAMATEPDEDEGPEWPKLAPGQKAGAEPAFDPNEKPDVPGISTDPGTSITCLPPVLKGVLTKIAARYGAVKVTSAWRPPWRARRGSYHRRCEAMDVRVPGVRPREVLEFARTLPEVGGNKVYWNGLIHIDTGPRRPW